MTTRTSGWGGRSRRGQRGCRGPSGRAPHVLRARSGRAWVALLARTEQRTQGREALRVPSTWHLVGRGEDVGALPE